MPFPPKKKDQPEDDALSNDEIPFDDPFSKVGEIQGMDEEKAAADHADAIEISDDLRQKLNDIVGSDLSDDQIRDICKAVESTENDQGMA